MAETWGVTVASGTSIMFRGVSDSADNLYWIECASECTAVSYTNSGTQRFRTPLGLPHPRVGRVGYDNVLHFIVDGSLVFAGAGSIGALSLADGSVSWIETLPANIIGAPDLADTVDVLDGAADSSSVWLAASRYLGEQKRQSVLFCLNASNGSRVFARFSGANRAFEGAVLDEDGNFYSSLAQEGNALFAPRVLFSLSPAGGERWRVASAAAISRRRPRSPIKEDPNGPIRSPILRCLR